MGKKIVAVNAGPRRGWNTDTLYADLVERYKQTLTGFVGPTQTFVTRVWQLTS